RARRSSERWRRRRHPLEAIAAKDRGCANWRHGCTAQAGPEDARAAWEVLVEAGDGDQRRPRPGEGRLPARKRAGHRFVAEAERGTEQTPQERAFPLGDVDARLLPEPRGQEALRRAAPQAGRRQARATQAVRAVILSPNSQPVWRRR